MRAQRGYATLDKNLSIRFSVNGGVMGSTLARASTYSADVKIWDPDALAGRAADAVTRVEIVSDGGAVVRSLALSAAAGSRTVTWRPTGLPSNGRVLLAAREHGLRRRHRHAGRHGLDRAGVDGPLTG